MSITFKQTIIHNLDLSMGQPLISKDCMKLTDETEAFVTRKIIKVMEEQGICEAQFKQQVSFYEEDEPYSIIQEWKDNKFKHLAEILAKRFYSYMIEYGNIANGDLIVTNYLMNDEEYVAILKINFNDGNYTHFYSHDDETMKLVTNKGIYVKKVKEAVVIKLSDASALLLDDSKSKYLSLMLDLDTKLSVKEKLRALDIATTRVIEGYYDNPIKALNELKVNINDSIARTSSINVSEIVEQTFGFDQGVLESCKEKLEEFGLNEEQTIQVNGSKLFSKYYNQKLKTDTGIEIKMPTHLFKDQDFFEIINESNGTQSLIIKNVSQLVNK